MIFEPPPYQVFCDGSKGQTAEKIILLCALVQTRQIFTDFTDDWRIALDAAPGIRYFHMREARIREGEFKGWKTIARDPKIISLAEVILKHNLHAISCCIGSEDYNAILRPASPSDLRDVFSLAFHVIIYTVAEYQLEVGLAGPADFIFDDEGEVGNEALLWYPAIKESASPHMRAIMGTTPVFRSDEQVLPLQAADLVAWHKRRKKEVPGRDIETIATQRVDELPGCERHVPKEWLIDMAAKMAKAPNIEQFRDGPSIYKRLKHAFRTGKREV